MKKIVLFLSCFTMLNASAITKDIIERCETNESCKPRDIEVCKIVKTTTETQAASCELKCEFEKIPATCSNSICLAPRSPPIPNFDPENPDCSNAI